MNWLRDLMWTPFHSMTRFRFDGDDDAGGGGADGGGGDGGSDSGKKTTDDPGTTTIKVNGQEMVVTHKELVEMAQKGAAADQRFEEASRLRKEADQIDEFSKKGVKILKTVEKIQSGKSLSEKEAREYLGLFGVTDEEQLSAGIAQLTGQEPKKMKPAKRDTDDDDQPHPIRRDDLDPELQEILDDAKQSKLEKIRTDIENDVKKAIASDDVLNSIVKALPKDKQAGVSAKLFEMAIERVKNRLALNREVFGPEMLKEVVQAVRHTVQTIGTRSQDANDLPGLQAGRGGVTEYFPSGNVPTDPIKRVSVSDPEYNRNLTQRLMQRAALARKRGRV